jgi:L-amino acid N-acyltransferase YncA
LNAADLERATYIALYEAVGFKHIGDYEKVGFKRGVLLPALHAMALRMQRLDILCGAP